MEKTCIVELVGIVTVTTGRDIYELQRELARAWCLRKHFTRLSCLHLLWCLAWWFVDESGVKTVGDEAANEMEAARKTTQIGWTDFIMYVIMGGRKGKWFEDAKWWDPWEGSFVRTMGQL
jgi:hypothetical protein